MNIILTMILLIFYLIVIIPLSIILRLFGRKFLDLKIRKKQNTYWNYKLDHDAQKALSFIDQPKISLRILIKFLLALRYLIYPQDLFNNNINYREKIDPKEIYPLW